MKLFDFGLAKELKPELNAKAEGYLLTGNTGSRRYMAPGTLDLCTRLSSRYAADNINHCQQRWLETCHMDSP